MRLWLNTALEREAAMAADPIGPPPRPEAAQSDPAPAAALPDDRSFARLFAEHAPLVARVLRRVGVPDADLEDVIQEVFVVLYRRWHEFRGESALRTWIYGIAVRKALSHRRRRHVRDEVALGDQHMPSQPPSQHSTVESDQQRAVLGDLLDKLDDKKREVFVLYELEQISMKEVATIVSAPLHTCYSRLHAARDELRAQLERLARKEALP